MLLSNLAKQARLNAQPASMIDEVSGLRADLVDGRRRHARGREAGMNVHGPAGEVMCGTGPERRLALLGVTCPRKYCQPLLIIWVTRTQLSSSSFTLE